MKKGRRHQTLKEQTHAKRYAQDAPGYRAPYKPIDVARPMRPPPPPPTPEQPLAQRLGGRARRDLKRLGVDPDAEESA